MARAWFTSCEAFSSSVMRETRSSTRTLTGCDGSRYGAVDGFAVCAAALSKVTTRTARILARAVFFPAIRLASSHIGKGLLSPSDWSSVGGRGSPGFADDGPKTDGYLCDGH